MATIEITKGMPMDRAGRVFEAWTAENVVAVRKISRVQDVKLANGKILPNRTLTREVYDLRDGRTVEIKIDARVDGVSGSYWGRYLAVEVGA